MAVVVWLNGGNEDGGGGENDGGGEIEVVASLFSCC